MENLRIIHLSDLHYSKLNEKQIIPIKEAILLDIDNYIIRNELKPNFIIFSGDLLLKPDDDEKEIDEFKNCYDFFIKPILERLGLTNDDIFITSGNHDVNRKILSRADKKGLLSYTEEDKSLVNNLIEEIIDGITPLKHLNQFNKFINSLNNKNLVYSNKLFNVYKFALGKIKIGIVNLNSNILAFENDSYGKLIIGEEQLLNASSKIKDCDIKIANIHHATNWLIWFEQILIKRFYYKNFNLVFLGHEHTEQPELVTFSDEDTLILNSASIYQGKNNINGYSLFDYDFANKSADIYIREYNNRETKFAAVTFSEVGNKYKYSFDIFEKTKNKKNLEIIIDEMSLKFKTLIKNELLINTARSENNSIEEVFVEPHIYDKSEFVDNESEEKEIFNIKKIITSKKNIIIKGIESSGKTTLLNFIANEYLNYNTPTKLIPILLNKLDIHDDLDDNIIHSKIIDFIRKQGVTISNKEVEKLLINGNFIFLVDNILENIKFENFIKNIPSNNKLKRNKFIFTVKEEIFDSLEETVNEHKLDVLELFIHNLKRAKAREFFGLYFKNNIKTNEFENMYKFISRLNIPLTIFNYTLIALTYEKQRNNFKPVNEAYLLDIFMENLLEKLDIEKNISIGSLGYSLKSDYLIYVAKWMVKKSIFSIDRYELIELTSQFIRDLKREKENINIEAFIKYMETKGIFVNAINNTLRFRYNAFLEFFIAKGMLQDESLKTLIINDKNCLNFKNEINYYSGLHGQNESLICFFKELLDGHKKYFESVISNDGKKIFTLAPEISNEKETIFVEQINQEKKDKLYEQRTINLKEKNDVKLIKTSEKIKEKTDMKQVFETNLLLTKVIRNSEQLKNPVLKTEVLSTVINNLSKFFQNFLNINYENEKLALEKTDEKDKDGLSHLFGLLNMVVSQAFMSVVQHNFVSDSLFTIYSEILDVESDDTILKLLVVSTMIYGNTNENLEHIENIIKQKRFSSNKFVMMGLFYKIFNAIKLGEIDNKFKSRLEKILTSIIIQLKYNEFDISGVQFAGVHKKNTIEGSRNEIYKKIKNSIDDIK